MGHARSAPSRIVGRYALFDAIAAGGMATVHYGRMVGGAGFTKTVAIKRLHAQFAMDPDFHAMFVDEARVAARIQHPNAVGTLDVVDLDGEIFLIMEYVPGEALSRLMRDSRTLGEKIPPKIVGSILSGVLYGLHAAHDAQDEHGKPLGIVHRDVSPHNIMIGKEGIPRVLDFGIAKAAGRMQNTREGQVKGKMSYMAPEQIASEPIDRRADVYSAGVVLWEALCGRRLFDGENQAAIMAKVVAGVVEPASEIRDDVPKALDAVIAKALAKNAFDRYATARELATAIEETLGLASPGVVGDWVGRFAGEALSMRAGRVKEIETLSSAELDVPAAAISSRGSDPGLRPEDFENTASIPDDDGPTKVEKPSIASQPSSTLTQRSNVTLASNSDPPKSRGKLFAVAAVLALSVVGIFTLMRSSEGETTAGDPVASSPVVDEPAADAAPEPAAAAAEPLPEASASAEAEPEPSATATAEPVATPPTVRRPAPRTPTPPKDPPKTKKNCDPPYYFDQDGVKRFKVECL